MRLQHLLLLLLRMLLIAALCLALARPRIVLSAVSIGNERAVAAVLVFDTSASMEYAAAGQTRLDEARQRARELLDEMADTSQVLVLDSADDAGGEPSAADWLSPSGARGRVEGLQVRPGNAPLNRQVERALPRPQGGRRPRGAAAALPLRLLRPHPRVVGRRRGETAGEA